MSINFPDPTGTLQQAACAQRWAAECWKAFRFLADQMPLNLQDRASAIACQRGAEAVAARARRLLGLDESYTGPFAYVARQTIAREIPDPEQIFTDTPAQALDLASAFNSSYEIFPLFHKTT